MATSSDDLMSRALQLLNAPAETSPVNHDPLMEKALRLLHGETAIIEDESQIFGDAPAIEDEAQIFEDVSTEASPIVVSGPSEQGIVIKPSNMVRASGEDIGLGMDSFIGAGSLPEVSSIAAANGIDFETPAPDGHFLSSLALNGKGRIAAYKLALKKHYGQDVDVRIGDKTKELEYLNPETGRYTLVSPPGSFQIGSLGGPAIAMTPELSAGVGAAIFTKSPHLTNLAASSGAFVGELSRLELGRQMGVNDITTETIIKEAAKEAGISLVSGEAARQVVKAGKFVIDVMNGRAFNQASLRGLDLSTEEAQRISDTINKRLGAEKMRFDVAQATGDDDLLAAKELYRRSSKFSERFGAFDDEQAAALEEFYKKINAPFRSRLESPEQVGGAVQDVAQSAVQRDLDRANIAVDMKRAELDAAERSIKTRPFEATGQEIRGVAEAESQAFRDWARGAAESLNRAAGDKAFIANKETVEAVRSIDDRVKASLFPSTQSSHKTLIGDAIGVTEEEQKGLRKVFDPKARFTFMEAWDAISALKRVERISSKGLSTEAPSVGAVRTLYKALEADLRASAQGSPLRGQYDDFIRRYAREKTLLDNSVVGKIMSRNGGKNGRFQVADEKVFREIFTPGSQRNASEVHQMIQGRPDAMQGMRESIGDFYQRTVMPDGRVNLRAHDRFMREHGRSAALFFNKEELRLLSKPGQLEAALQAREKARDLAVKKINKTFESQIADLNNPGKVVRLIMDPTNPDKARQMMDVLEKTPDVKRAVRAQFVRDMTDRVKTLNRNGERSFSPKILDRFLNGNGGESGFRSVAKEVMGEKYVEDLTVLNEALKISSRTARTTANVGNDFWGDTIKNMARAYVGLFTRPGRIITAIDKIRGRAAEKVMAEAMLNPDNMKALMSLRGVSMRSQKAAVILGNMGGSALLPDFYEEPRPTGTLK